MKLLNLLTSHLDFDLENGAVLIPPWKGSPLHKGVLRSRPQIVSKFLSLGFNPNFPQDLRRTPLHDASLFGHRHIFRMLLLAGACPYIQDDLDNSAVSYAHKYDDSLSCLSRIVKRVYRNPKHKPLIPQASLLLPWTPLKYEIAEEGVYIKFNVTD